MKNSFYIDDDFANSRLDRWIKRQICRIPQSLIEKSTKETIEDIYKKAEEHNCEILICGFWFSK